MIAQQQEEIVRREEMKRAKSGVIKSRGEGGPPTGGVRILPPSPTTVREELTSSPPAMSVNSASSVSTYKESKQFSSMTSSSETKMVVGEKLHASASQASVGHSLSQTSIGAGSSSQSVYDMMYDAQVLSPIMSTNNVPLMNESDLLAMTQSGGLSKAKNEVVVRRGEVSKTTEMVQQKSESVR